MTKGKTQIAIIEKAVTSRKKGLTATEIADKFGFNEGSVRTQLGRLVTQKSIKVQGKRVDRITGRPNNVFVGR